MSLGLRPLLVTLLAASACGGSNASIVDLAVEPQGTCLDVVIKDPGGRGDGQPPVLAFRNRCEVPVWVVGTRLDPGRALEYALGSCGGCAFHVVAAVEGNQVSLHLHTGDFRLDAAPDGLEAGP
jgi:hypothetical protein